MRPWEKNIRVVEPYVPGEQPKLSTMIKLNTNENPYPPTNEITQLKMELDTNQFRMYPDATVAGLVDELASYYHLEQDQVFVGVGSDDVLATAFLTFFNSEKPILFPDITYSFYEVWANLYRIPFQQPALNNDFRIIKEDYYQENGGVVIANPNAPTSICEGLDFIEDILKHNQDVIVIVDEAYIDFGGQSAIELIPKYDNLLVVQTFSKSRSVAGLRIGYCMGHKDLIKALNNVKYSINSYTMNTPAMKFGVLAVKDEAYFQSIIKKIVHTREWAKEEFQKCGFTCFDSKTNFLFVTHKSKPASEIYESLKDRNIFVRYFNKPRIDNYLRITIGTDEEMRQLFVALTEIGC